MVLDDIVVATVQVREIRLQNAEVFLQHLHFVFQFMGVCPANVVNLLAARVSLQLLFVQNALLYIGLQLLPVQITFQDGLLHGYPRQLLPGIVPILRHIRQQIQQIPVLLSPLPVQKPQMPLLRLQIDVRIVQELLAPGIAQVAVQQIAVLVEPGDVVCGLQGIFLEFLRPGAEDAIEAAEYHRKGQAYQNPPVNPGRIVAQPLQASALSAVISGSRVWLLRRFRLLLFLSKQSHSALLLSLPHQPNVRSPHAPCFVRQPAIIVHA